MSEKEFKTTPVTLITREENEEKEEVTMPKLKMEVKPRAKKEIKEDVYIVAGESPIILNGQRFVKGDIVTVRPIPRFYLEHGHIRKL
jgi:hypothetical protein